MRVCENVCKCKEKKKKNWMRLSAKIIREIEENKNKMQIKIICLLILIINIK